MKHLEKFEDFKTRKEVASCKARPAGSDNRYGLVP